MTTRILQVVQEFSTAGGAETVAFELSHAFSRIGVSNAVLATRIDGMPGPLTAVSVIGNVLSRVPTRGAFRYVGRLLAVPLFSLISTASVGRFRNDIVISHGDCMAGDLMVIHAVNAASLAEKRADGHWRWRLNPMHYLVGLRDSWTLGCRRFRRYIAVSGRVEAELIHYYNVPKERIRIIPNGIDLKRFVVSPEAGAVVRQEFGIPADARVLLFAGHEFRRKGLEFVVRALDRLPADFRLLVVGSDDPAPYRALLPHLNDRILFAGARRNMTDFYAAADAFVFPTNYETFSLVCMEALACGTPVLATRVGGIEDYIVDGENGFFITRDPELIASRITELFADPDRLHHISKAARATAENYSWDQIAAQYIAVAEEVEAEKRAAGT